MVSIMPGIETRAPLRTETSSGSAAAPKRLPRARLELAHRGAELVGQPVGQTPTRLVERAGTRRS